MPATAPAAAFFSDTLWIYTVVKSTTERLNDLKHFPGFSLVFYYFSQYF